MVEGGTGRNGPQLTWPNIIATLVFGLMLFATLIGGTWVTLNNNLDAERRATALALAAQKEREILLQEQINRRFGDVERELTGIRAEQDRRRHEFIRIEAFSEFQKRVDQYMATPFLTQGIFDASQSARDKRLEQIDRRIDSLDKGPR
jgi:hypothetical protein